MNKSLTVEQLNSEEVGRQGPLLVFLGMVVSTGIPGNITVCVVYWAKSVSRFIIWWLAVIDTISCFGIPLEIVSVVKQYTYTNMWLCKFTIFLTIWPIITSAFALCLISFDRFQRVCTPHQIQISQQKAKCMCLSTVAIALAISLPSLILFGTYTEEISDHNLTSSSCAIQNEYQGTNYALCYHIFIYILFLFVLIFLSVCYTMIGRKIYKQMGLLRPSMTSNNDVCTNTSFTVLKTSQNVCKENCNVSQNMSTLSNRSTVLGQDKARKSTVMMFFISFVFVVSFLPILISRMIEAFDLTFEKSMSDTGRACYKFFELTYFLNCAINPFIYCACAATFRQEVRAYFRLLISRFR
jgi:hypothetical protein